MSKMTGEPCPVASYTIQKPSHERHKPDTMVKLKRFKIPSWSPEAVRYLAIRSWANQTGSSQELEIVQRLLGDGGNSAVQEVSVETPHSLRHINCEAFSGKLWIVEKPGACETEPCKAQSGECTPGVRVFVVHSEERAAFERAQRIKAMERVGARLTKLEQRVASGRLKAAAKIGAAAARILSTNHGHRYYDWSCADGVFRFFEPPVHFPREQAYEGKYVIQTEEPDLSAVDAVRLYKELSEVERAFANLKDVIDMRPIYHRTDHRVEAHIFIAALAFLIHRAIEKKLKAAGLDLSATEALNALKSVRVVDIALGDHSTKRCVTRGTQRAATVLRALGITDLDPPTPPQPGETVM